MRNDIKMKIKIIISGFLKNKIMRKVNFKFDIIKLGIIIIN